MTDKTFDHGLKPSILDEAKESTKAPPVQGDRDEFKRLTDKLAKLRFETYRKPIYDAVRIQPIEQENVTLTGGATWVPDAESEIAEIKRRIDVIDPNGELAGDDGK